MNNRFYFFIFDIKDPDDLLPLICNFKNYICFKTDPERFSFIFDYGTDINIIDFVSFFKKFNIYRFCSLEKNQLEAIVLSLPLHDLVYTKRLHF